MNKRTIRAKGLHGFETLALVCGLVLSAGCDGGGEAPADRRSMVVISVDSIRADLLSVYGGEVGMPNLDKLGAAGVVFDDVATVAPMARPAVATLMTGLTPDEHGVRDDLADVLPAPLRTLAEVHGAAGRSTAAFVGTPFVSIASGLDRGFELFDGPEGIETGSARYYPARRSAEEVSDNFAAWIESLPADRDFLAWVHWSDLYGRITMPRQEDPRAYALEGLSTIDAALGTVLAALDAAGRAANTEVWFVGTHGAMLNEEKIRGSSFWLRDETLRVPVVWRPASDAGQAGGHDARPLWLPDLARTLTHFDSKVDGPAASLRDPAGAVPPRRRQAWTWAHEDQLGWSGRTAVRDGSGWQLIDAPAPRVRHLPDENRAAILAAGLPLAPAGTLTDGGPPVEILDQFLGTLSMLRHDAAMEKAAAVARRSKAQFDRYPESLPVLTNYLNVLTRRRDPSATSIGDRLLALYPDRAEALHWSAHAWLTDGNMTKAEVLLDGALAIGPRDPDVLYDLACVRALDGDTDGAVARLQEAVDAGFRYWELMELDQDLASIRSDPRYLELVVRRGS